MIGLCAKCAMWIVYMIKKSGKQTKKKQTNPLANEVHTLGTNTRFDSKFSLLLSFLVIDSETIFI